MTADCSARLNLCIAQSSARTFSLSGPSTDDYSGFSEITFDIWEKPLSGANILSIDLTGGRITLANPSTVQFKITHTESGNFTPGTKHCECWGIDSDSNRVILGKGQFLVEDTRKHDA